MFEIRQQKIYIQCGFKPIGACCTIYLTQDLWFWSIKCITYGPAVGLNSQLDGDANNCSVRDKLNRDWWHIYTSVDLAKRSFDENVFENVVYKMAATLFKHQRDIRSMGSCKKDVTPLLTHWSYVFLALTHRDDVPKGVYLYPTFKRVWMSWQER